MAQLHLYVPESIAEIIRRRAKAQGLSVSKYLAEVVARDAGAGWPDGYFDDVVGQWKGEPLDRDAQGEPEPRDPMA